MRLQTGVLLRLLETETGRKTLLNVVEELKRINKSTMDVDGHIYLLKYVKQFVDGVR